MGKIKTNSGAKKRFKVSGSGKIMRKKAFKSHLLGKKKKDRKKRLGKTVEIFPGDVKRVKAMLNI